MKWRCTHEYLDNLAAYSGLVHQVERAIEWYKEA